MPVPADPSTMEAMRFFGWLLVALASLAAVATVDPAWLGWSMHNGIAQVIGVRSWLAALLGALAVLVLITAGVVHAATGRAARRLLTITMVLALVAVAHVGVLASRGLDSGTVPVAEQARDGDVTVIAANLLGGRADSDAVVDLALTAGADVLALPEAGQQVAQELADRLAGEGMQFQVFPDDGSHSPARGTSLLVSTQLGTYRQVETEEPGTVIAESVHGTGPPLAAVHPIAVPVNVVQTWRAPAGRMDQWRSEVRAAVQTMADLPGGIVAGDFNATLDHESLRGLETYIHTGQDLGIGGHGTFPAFLPGVLSASIDHVFIDGAVFEATAGAVVPIAGSDHRAVVIRVSPQG